MPHFVYDDTGLDFPKVDKNAVPPGEVDKHLRAGDWNKACQALIDVKTLLREGLWLGLDDQAADPVPAGINDYLWLKTDGKLHVKSNGVDNEVAYATDLTVDADNLTIEGDGSPGDPLRVIGEATAGVVGGGVWAPPTTPHAYDDEFDSGTSLNGAWTISVGSIGATAPDPYASFAVGDSRVSHNVQRRHWLRIQPVANNVELAITKTIPSLTGTDFAVWMRGSFNHRTAAAVNNDFSFGLMLSTAPYDATNRVILCINDSDGGVIQSEFSKNVAGVNTSVGTTANIAPNDHTAFEGVLIQKTGTTFYGWVITNNGSCVYMGSTTFAPAIGTAGFWATNNATTAPGNAMVAVDCIRFVPGTTFLP